MVLAGPCSPMSSVPPGILPLKRKYSWRCTTMGAPDVISADNSVVLCGNAAEAALTSNMYCDCGPTATVVGLTARLLYSGLTFTVAGTVGSMLASTRDSWHL